MVMGAHLVQLAVRIHHSAHAGNRRSVARGDHGIEEALRLARLRAIRRLRADIRRDGTINAMRDFFIRPIPPRRSFGD